MRSRVEELFPAVADLPTEARARYFAENEVDPKIQRVVEGLVAFDSPSTTSLDEDIGSVALGALERVEQQDGAWILWRHWDAKLPNNTFVRRQLAAAIGPSVQMD